MSGLDKAMQARRLPHGGTICCSMAEYNKFHSIMHHKACESTSMHQQQYQQYTDRALLQAAWSAFGISSLDLVHCEWTVEVVPGFDSAIHQRIILAKKETDGEGSEVTKDAESHVDDAQQFADDNDQESGRVAE